MAYIYQKTIGKEVSYTGIGLHTGENVLIKFKPAGENEGIHFIRTDLPEKPKIAATIDNVTDVLRGTSIGCGDVKIHTVEHVLCALGGLGITNLLIEVDGSEVPAVDGSAMPFVEIFENEAGIVKQEAKRRVLTIDEPMQVIEADKQLVVLPSDEFKISFTVEYNNSVIGTQYAKFPINEKTFKKEIASARTYGFLSEVEYLKSKGLALGGSVENAIVVGENEIMNDSLRWKDEFVRHKILDLVGDLFLIGVSLKGHFIGIKSGHEMNFKMAQKLKKLADDPRKQETKMDIKRILEILPHRYPFLLVDKIVHMESGKSAIGVKNVTFNEQFFQGHFPGEPYMPGVLICEALAQVAGVLMLKEDQHKGKVPFFGGIESFRFRKPVRPGDTLYLEIQIIKIKGSIGKVKGIARVDNHKVAEGILTFSLI